MEGPRLGWLLLFTAGLLIVSLAGGVKWASDKGYFDTEEVVEEEAIEEAPTEEVAVSPIEPQWTPPMRRWFEAGNRISVDFVHEEGWCAVAIQRPPTEEGGQPTIQCIK